MKTKASIDTPAKLITALYFVLMIVPGGLALRKLAGPPDLAPGWTQEAAIFAGLALIGLACWLMAPRWYSFDAQNLEIDRPAGSLRIPLREISSVDELPREALRGMIRTFGVGGFFGYYGKFYAPGIGHLVLHASRMQGLVLITTNAGKKIVISPDDGTFAAKLRGMIAKG